MIQPVSVPRLWPGATVVCLATGPSLKAEDVAFVRGKARVVAVNNAITLAPFADVLWASDAKWYRWHQGVPSFKGLKYCLEGTHYRDVRVLRPTGRTGLELSPTGVKTGENSGYAAINCAVHLGATRIVLLGYDMQYGPKGERHFFGDHPIRATRMNESYLANYATLVAPLHMLNVSIVNCTRRTALKCFPRETLEAVMAQCEAAA